MTAPMVVMQCPSQEALAAFIDGRLSPEKRAEVVSHLASCADCRDLVLLAIDFQQSEGEATVNEEVVPPAMGAQVPPPNVVPFGKRILGYAGALAVAAAVVFAFLQYNRPGIDDLVAATAGREERGEAGRLSAPFPHRPLKGTPRGSKDEEAHWQILQLAAELENDRDLHRRGVALFLAGEYDRAIAALTVAHGNLPDDVDITLDLAAAHLERGRRRGANADLEAAIKLADEAWKREQRPEALWNRAMALTYHSERADKEALRAWDDYLKIDPHSPWATEARDERAKIADFM